MYVDHLIARSLAPLIMWVSQVTRHSKYALFHSCNFFAMALLALTIAGDKTSTFYSAFVFFLLGVSFYYGTVRAEMKMISSLFLRLLFAVVFMMDLYGYFAGIDPRLTVIIIEFLFLFGQYALFVLPDDDTYIS